MFLRIFKDDENSKFNKKNNLIFSLKETLINMFNQIENSSNLQITPSDLQEVDDSYGWNSFFEENSNFSSNQKENLKSKDNDFFKQKGGNLESGRKIDWAKNLSSSLNSPTVVWPSTSRSGKFFRTTEFNSMNNHLNWLDSMKSKVIMKIFKIFEINDL